MALMDDVKEICDRLSDHGWRELMLSRTNGVMDIRQNSLANLRTALLKDIEQIDRSGPFSDLHLDCQRAIEPGDPARSLLYHALANPRVLRGKDGRMLGMFPSEDDIDTIESFIFATANRTLSDVVERSGVKKLSIVVFATEYRTRPDTVSKAHADLVFSRTGIARVGTADPEYDPMVRGYWPEDESDPHAIRVIPTRYSAWLAAPIKGSEASVMRIDAVDSEEARRRFWRPMHKLFDGTECLVGHDLKLEGSAAFFNMKLKRVRESLGHARTPDKPPFVITDGLADLVEKPVTGTFQVVPIAKPSLVEPAFADGQPATFKVPENGTGSFATHVTPFGFLPDNTEIHRYPAYVHARTRVEDGQFIDLNEEKDVNGAVNAGGYEALHYLDFTGEGWVNISVPALAKERSVVDKSRAAYCILAAPDFFPSAGQRELSEWSVSDDVPGAFRRGEIWGVVPAPLSETRLPANLQLPRNPFDKNEETITAVVTMGDQAPLPNTSRLPDIRRASTLSDDAAGVFAPGWAVSVDVKGELDEGGTPHLATYGLGSPFPEDAKLCAALSTFWPAVSPDIYRSLSTHMGNARLRGTVAPLTDDEIGQDGSLPWDGISGPRIVTINGQEFAEMASFLHADYVASALENRFSIRNTARIDSEEYQRRVLVAARVHWVLSGRRSVSAVRPQVFFLSFKSIPRANPELSEAQQESNHILTGDVYRVETTFVGRDRRDPTSESPRGPAFRMLPLRGRQTFFVSAQDPTALQKRAIDARWRPALAE